MSERMEALKAALTGRYEIEKELGHGGMATVYLARDVRHERMVAVKVLKPDLASALGPERFLREIRIAATEFNCHAMLAVFFDRYDTSQNSFCSRLGFFAQVMVQRSDNIVGSQTLAVMEFDTFADFEIPGFGVRAGLPAFC